MRMQIKVPVSILKEGRAFVAYTPALDLSTSGKTLAQAQRRFEEAVALFFEELQKMGTLDATLSDLGWVKVKRRWHSPMPVVNRTTELRVQA